MAMGKKQSRYCYREVLPFTAMVVVECSNVGLSTLFKAASTKGMSYRVFIVYSFAISAICLAPLAFLVHRFSAQMFGYKGIDYSSPTLSSAISNLTPAITFALALIFRMEKLVIRSARSQAKILGTIVSISGALVVVLYEGPAVIRSSSSSLSSNNMRRPLTSPSISDWTVGGLFLTADYILLSIWYIVQNTVVLVASIAVNKTCMVLPDEAQTVRMYPAELLVVLLYNICVTLISAPVCLMIEPNLSSWRIGADIMLVTILYAGIVGSSFGTVVHTWGLRVKGPVYVALFRPLSIAIAAIMGVIFLGDTLYLGSVIGAILISIGFYIVLWGKAKDEPSDESESTLESASTSTQNEPLLR
ncbi:hypothetical protein LguiB_010323 [Lonicera macranthoides]